MKAMLHSPPENHRRRSRQIDLLIVIFIILAFSLFTYFYLIKTQGPFCWDEAHHSTFSALIARSLLEKNWRAFWHYTNRQIYWPFLHSWISALFLMLGGFSYQVARCTNLVTGGISLVFIYLIGNKLAEREGGRIGVVAALLMVVSPMFLFYSATAMVENLGCLLTLVLVWLQLTAGERGGGRYYFISGVTLALLYLTKYIYAMFFGLTLVCFWASLLVFPEKDIKKKSVLKNIWWVALGFLIIWGVWMVIPPSAPKLNVVLYRIKDTGGWNPSEFTKLENRLFYLRALLYAYTFSIGIYLLYLGGAIYGIIRFKKAKIRFLFLLFLANVIPMSRIVNSQTRFIYVGIPALYLLTASAINWFWLNAAPKWRWTVAVIISLVVLGDLPKMPVYVKQLGNALMGACPFKVRNEFNYSTAFGLTSYPKFLRFPKEYFNPKAFNVVPRHNTQDALDFIWKNTNPRAPICAPFYIGTLSPHIWHWHSIVKNRPVFTNWRPDGYYFISLEIAEDSPYVTLGNVHLIEGVRKWDAFLSNLQKQGLMKLVREKYFKDIGLRVKIYIKSRPLQDPIWQQIRFS